MTTYGEPKADWFVGLAERSKEATGHSATQRYNQDGARQRNVTRTLYVAMGDNAPVVTAEAERLSTHWMQMQPPLVTLTGAECGAGSDSKAADDDATGRIDTALHALAAQELVTGLQQQGYVVQRHDEIQVFLVADVAADVAEKPHGSAAGANSRRSPNTVAANPAAAMLAALRRVEAHVRRELRARTVPHVLLLARPADQACVAACVKTLQAGGIGDVWLTGAVTAEHQRLDDEAWLHRSARALAALTWAALPSHAYAEFEDGVRVLGAAGWDTALPAVRRWLSLRSAGEALRLLTEDRAVSGHSAADDAPPMPALLTENIEGLLQSLASATLSPMPQQPWSAESADWAQIAELVDRITATEKQADNRHQVRVRQTRFAWLEAQMNEWTAWVRAQTQNGLTSAAELPQLAAYRASVMQAATQIAMRADAMAELIERAEAEVEQATAAVQTAGQQVMDAVAVFPPYSLKGLMTMLLQPWRWPAWVWFYAYMLPNRCRELLTALAAQRRALWYEANLHTLRQMIHAAQHDLNRMTAELGTVEQAVGEAGAALAKAAERERTVAFPWTEATLQALWEMQEAETVAERCRLYLTRRPLASWSSGSVTGELTAAMTNPEPPLTDWTALDCLVEGLTYAEQGKRNVFENLLRSAPAQEPFAWLDAVYAAAAPLWPRPALAQGAIEQSWLLVPTYGGQRAGVMSESSNSLAKFYWWAETQSEPMQVCWLAGDAVVALRWMQLSVKDLEAEF